MPPRPDAVDLPDLLRQIAHGLGLCELEGPGPLVVAHPRSRQRRLLALVEKARQEARRRGSLNTFRLLWLLERDLSGCVPFGGEPRAPLGWQTFIDLAGQYHHDLLFQADELADAGAGAVNESRGANVIRFENLKNAQVFLCYAHQDAKWREELLTMLAPPLRDKALDLWYDGRIKPSQDWRREIEAALKRAQVGILLVSKHFLASGFINSNELPFLIDAAEKHKVRLSWVLLGDCLHEGQEFTKLQALHDITKPVAALPGTKRDTVLKQIAQKILELAR